MKHASQAAIRPKRFIVPCDRGDVYAVSQYREISMTMDDTVREKIGTFKVFEGLSSDEIDAVIACGTVVHFKCGEKIIEESAESTDLYVVLNGRVSIEMMVQNHSSPAQRAK